MTTNITAEMCEAKVVTQTRFHDAEVKGLYVYVTPTCTTTFHFKSTCPRTHRQRGMKIGNYHREIFNIEMARAVVRELKTRLSIGEDVFQTRRQAACPEPGWQEEEDTDRRDRRNFLRRQRRAQQDRAAKDRRNQRERERRLRVHAILCAMDELGWDSTDDDLQP